MRVAGIMSGTSLDGIDVAIVDIARKGGGIRITPVAFRSSPYPKLVREALLAISNSMSHTATLARLNFLLGELYASTLIDTCKRGTHPAPAPSSFAACTARPSFARATRSNIWAIASPTPTLPDQQKAAVVAEQHRHPRRFNFREDAMWR